MAISTRQDEPDDWTARFFQEIEDWFREQDGCVGRSEAEHAVRLGLEPTLAEGENCLGEHLEAEQATWAFRPY